MSSRLRLGALASALLVLTACTGVPRQSAPQVVRTVDRGGNAQSAEPNISPNADAGPRDIVSDFITAGVAADAGHSTSRQFLTNAAARKWQDNTVTVVDETTVGVPSTVGSGARVEVIGHRVGQLDANGVFSPTLKGTGVGDQETFSFGLRQLSGQWRIDQLQPGVLISQRQFQDNYLPRKLYFFDSGETTLVPDLRYSALDGQALATWLLDQLLVGPRPELAQSVLNEVPDQVGRPSVQLGDPIVVEMPGTAQLDAAGKNGLAAQLAYTLGQVAFAGGRLRLTDAGRTVGIPDAAGPIFSSVDFTFGGPDSAPPGVTPYFLRNGAVISGLDDKPVTGPLGQPVRKFSSVALRRGNSGGLDAAGVSASTLRVGNVAKLADVRLPTGALSRPEWRPHADEVWVGVGTSGAIYRVGPGTAARAVSITSPVGGLSPGQVLALRFSSDGVRLAAVLRAANGTKTAWIGSVVTSGDDVRIDSFEPLTPARLSVTDIAWADPTKLLIVAQAPGDETRVWQVQSDGSYLGPLSNVGLPGVPTSIAASSQQSPLVSASDSIWTQRGSGWTSFPGATPTAGVNPVYAP